MNLHRFERTHTVTCRLDVSILRPIQRPTRAERRARSRPTLLGSAAKGLSRYGYGNLVPAEVARDASYTRGALNHQFTELPARFVRGAVSRAHLSGPSNAGSSGRKSRCRGNRSGGAFREETSSFGSAPPPPAPQPLPAKKADHDRRRAMGSLRSRHPQSGEAVAMAGDEGVPAVTQRMKESATRRARKETATRQN